MRQKRLLESMSHKAWQLAIMTTIVLIAQTYRVNAQMLQVWVEAHFGNARVQNPTWQGADMWSGDWCSAAMLWAIGYALNSNVEHIHVAFTNPTGGDAFGRMSVMARGVEVVSPDLADFRVPCNRWGGWCYEDYSWYHFGTWQGSGHSFRATAAAWGWWWWAGNANVVIDITNAPMVSATTPTVNPFDISPYVRRGKVDPRTYSGVPLSWSSTACSGYRGRTSAGYHFGTRPSPHSDVLRYRYDLEIKRNGQPFDSRSHEERVSWSWYEDASTKDLPPLNGSYSIPLGLAQMGSRYSITLKVRLVHDGYYDNFYAYAGSVSLFERTYTAEFLVSVPADIDNSGCVDDADLLAVLFAFGSSGSDLPEDVDGNGIVDDADLLTVLFDFGLGC